MTSSSWPSYSVQLCERQDRTRSNGTGMAPTTASNSSIAWRGSTLRPDGPALTATFFRCRGSRGLCPICRLLLAPDSPRSGGAGAATVELRPDTRLPHLPDIERGRTPVKRGQQGRVVDAALLLTAIALVDLAVGRHVVLIIFL